MLAIAERLHEKAEQYRKACGDQSHFLAGSSFPIANALHEVADAIQEELEGGDFERRVSEDDSS